MKTFSTTGCILRSPGSRPTSSQLVCAFLTKREKFVHFSVEWSCRVAFSFVFPSLPTSPFHTQSVVTAVYFHAGMQFFDKLLFQLNFVAMSDESGAKGVRKLVLRLFSDAISLSEESFRDLNAKQHRKILLSAIRDWESINKNRATTDVHTKFSGSTSVGISDLFSSLSAQKGKTKSFKVDWREIVAQIVVRLA